VGPTKIKSIFLHNQTHRNCGLFEPPVQPHYQTASLAAMHHKGSLINYNHTKKSAWAGIIYPVRCDELLVSNLMQT
jgi:hypothetical protein